MSDDINRGNAWKVIVPGEAMTKQADTKRTILEQARLDKEAFARMPEQQRRAAENELRSIGHNPGVTFGKQADTDAIERVAVEAIRELCFGLNLRERTALVRTVIQATELTDLRNKVAGLTELLSEALIYVDDCFGDLDRNLASRITQALATHRDDA